MGELRISNTNLAAYRASSNDMKMSDFESASIYTNQLIELENLDEFIRAPKKASKKSKAANKTETASTTNKSKNDSSKKTLNVSNIRKQTSDVALKRAIKGINTKYEKLTEMKDLNQRENVQKLAKREIERVVQKCQKYNMLELAPIIAFRLGEETGGYVYPGESKEKKSLHSPDGTYFGSMQVDNTVLECIYGENSKNKRIKYDYEHYYSNDEKFINIIKKQYPTIQKLKDAMKTDVDLGLEIGILYFRSRLRFAKGNVNAAHEKYCGRSIPSKVPHPKNFNVDK